MLDHISAGIAHVAYLEKLAAENGTPQAIPTASELMPAPAGTGITPSARPMTKIIERNLSTFEQGMLVDIRQAALDFMNVLNRATGREIGIAKQKVEEAQLWATKGITS